MLFLKPIKRPKLRAKAWYKLNVELSQAERTMSRRKRKALLSSIGYLMSKLKTPGSENNRVLPDKRLAHKQKETHAEVL